MTKQTLVRALTKAQTRIRTSPLTRSLCTSPLSDSPLKNVTNLNFEPSLAELRTVIREADFVSIDLEMTGLTSAPWRECFEFDRPDIQYLKVKDSAGKFAVVQFGVCPFRWDSHTNALIAHPYNFYIFPRHEIQSVGLSPEFLCQTSSMEFLARYQFDFNTCIHEGISYLSRSQEEEALRLLDNKDELFDSSSSVTERLVRMTDILFSERMKIKIREWRAGLLGGRSDFHGSPNDTNQKFQTTFFQMRPALVLNGLTSRQLRLIKLVTNKHFKDIAYVQVTDKPAGLQPLLVYTDSIADRDMLMREVKVCRRKEAEMNIKAAIGFRHVIDLLSAERKLIVGHNCFLDLAHVYSKFFGPLPSTAEEFVSAVQKYFPYVIDTKVMLNSNDVLLRIMKRGSTSLSKAFNLLCSQVAAKLPTSALAHAPCVKVEVQVDNQRFVAPPDSNGPGLKNSNKTNSKRFSNWNSGAKHEAGYDAFMTGSIFAQACCHLGIKFDSLPAPIDLAHHEQLQKYANHLYLSWVNGDIISFKTGNIAADSSSSNKRQNSTIMFANMVLLWGHTPNLSVRDFRDCLNKVFGVGSVTSIYHLDETAGFIQFSKEHLVSNFLELKDNLERANDPISVLHPLSKLLEAGCVCGASYEMYKEICSSPISEVLFADQVKAMGIKWKTRLTEHATEVEKQEEYSSCCCTVDENADSLYLFEAQSRK